MFLSRNSIVIQTCKVTQKLYRHVLFSQVLQVVAVPFKDWAYLLTAGRHWGILTGTGSR